MKIFLDFIRLIHIHPILIIFIFISFITGTFVHLFIILSIVFIHESGHYFAANFYQWRIHSIVMWVFGGVMKTDESGTRPLKEDVIVTLAGPVQHFFIYILIISLSFFQLVPDSIIQLAIYYNFIIFMFNMLPIYPLDGGKLLFFILSYFIPFKKAHQYTILFSIVLSICIIILQVLLLPFTLSSLLIITFLLFENRTERKNHYYIFIRFLLNRYSYEHRGLKTNELIVSGNYRLIDVFALFKRNHIHEIYMNKNKKRCLSEKRILRLYFKEKLYDKTIEEIIKKS